MKKLLPLIGTVILSAALVGCNDTAQGAMEDTQENSKAVAKAADEAGENIEKAAKETGEAVSNAGEAVKLTPQIQAAIVANPILNEDGNSINVDTDQDFVYLRGHVMKASMKADAEKIAQKILQENNASQKIKNELEVKG